MDILRYVLSFLRRGKLAVTECNDASETKPYSEKGFLKWYLFKIAQHFSHNDLISVMSALLIKKMSSEDNGKFLN